VPDPTIGVYVHIPFCERICPYCGFAAVPTRPLTSEREDRYLRALLAELRLRRDVFAGRRLASLYFGGGTPSLLRPSSIARIIGAVGEAFASRGKVETSLEVNPSTVERSRLPAFREAGVDRLSVGVQSFDALTLRRLGRAPRASEARATLREARTVGFTNLSIDLIFGVPGQDPDGFRRDLESAIAFAPEHVSVYGLTVEEGTPYATAIERGRLALPEEDEVVVMMLDLRERLERAGIRQYEISNFARPGFESVHNRRYWERQPVLGLGMGAWSTDPPGPEAPYGLRRSNRRGLDAYLERIESGLAGGDDPPEILDARTARGEAAFLALRTARGLAAGPFEAEFGVALRDVFGPAIEELAGVGLLEENGRGDLRLTPAGWLLSDSVFERFV
jgi:oxygen-independent coproporphyrinogen-3 oxidase